MAFVLDPVSNMWLVAAGLVVGYLLIAKGIAGYRQRKTQQRLAIIRERYGQPHIRDRDGDVLVAFLPNRDFANTSYVDDQTWKDLDLDSVLALIDRTLSTPGEIELHRFLRCLSLSAETIQERDSVVTSLQDDASLREAIQIQLDALGRTEYFAGVLEVVWDDRLPSTRFRHVVAGLAFASITAMASFLLTATTPLLIFSIVFTAALYFVNLVVHYRFTSQHAFLTIHLRYVSKMVHIAGQIAKLATDTSVEPKTELDARLLQLHSDYELTKSVPHATRYLSHSRKSSTEIIDLVIEYISIITLSEVRSLMRASDAIRDSHASLQRLFVSMGEIDALQGIASYRFGLSQFTRPDFIRKKQLKMEHAVHPLLEDPQPNSVLITDRQYLITGSNMSGKSTLLRTAGVNAILAQSISTCTASSYQASFFHVMSSITPTDNLLQGKSFYLAEAERLHEMIRCSSEKETVLCIVDEVLRGTNTKERVAAACAILSFLPIRNAVVIAATHDVELTGLLANDYETHHFTEQIDSDGLQFDYQIRPGSATSANAIRLLEILGYPAEIVRTATDCHANLSQQKTHGDQAN